MPIREKTEHVRSFRVSVLERQDRHPLSPLTHCEIFSKHCGSFHTFISNFHRDEGVFDTGFMQSEPFYPYKQKYA